MRRNVLCEKEHMPQSCNLSFVRPRAAFQYH